MLIDNKGNIFGKVNIIDLFLIAVVIFVGVFIFRRTVSDTVFVTQEDIILEIFVEHAPDFVGEAIQIGGRVLDESRGVDLGVITDIEIDNGFRFFPNSDGQVTRSYQEGYSSIKVTTLTQGQFTDNGVIIAGNRYAAGHSLTVFAGQGKFWGVISNAERVDS